MLTIISHGGAIQRWHVGESKPKAIMPPDIATVVADGDELSCIRHNFRNIPEGMTETVTWYGDVARFIVANL